MKRILTQAFLLFISLQVLSLHAQEKQDFAPTRIIKGAVIDKNGNPIPGATVRSTRGAETAITDADGTYSIEVPFWLKSLTASYPGLRDQKLNTTDKTITIFTLKPLYRTYGFVNVMFANVWQVKPTGGYNDKVQQLGVMGGAYRKWGGYAKVMFGIHGSSNGRYEYENNITPEPTVTGGVIKPMSQNLNVFAGIGMASNYNFWEYHWGVDRIYYDLGWALAFEGGLMYRCWKINGILGLTYATKRINSSYTYNSGNLSLFIGLGMNI